MTTMRKADMTTTERGPAMDGYTASMITRARWAKQHNDSWPKGVWSTGERVIVALILNNTDALEALGETEQSVRSRLAGDLGSNDVETWLAGVRAEVGNPGDGEASHASEDSLIVGPASETIPDPWPKDQEPPTGINVLRDVDNEEDGYLTYLCRVTDRPGHWSWQDEPEHSLVAADLQGRLTRDWSTTLANSSTGTLIVCPPRPVTQR
jgi:hypothetical protein